MQWLLDIFRRANTGHDLTPAERGVLRFVKFFFTNSGIFLSLPFVGTAVFDLEQYAVSLLTGVSAHLQPINWQLEGVVLLVALAQAGLEALHKWRSALAENAKTPSKVDQALMVLTDIADHEMPTVLGAIAKRYGLTGEQLTQVQSVAIRAIDTYNTQIVPTVKP